jgi:predicted phosphodiesterase
MKYAIVSDIHANLQAWKAVLLDIRSFNLDQIICLGDIVGYGPNPAEVLQSVYENIDHFVLGNHDAVICGKLEPTLFNENAREIILWTQDNLSPDAMKFLKTLPLSLHGNSFRCAHGDFGEPAAFNYVIDPEDALPSWQTVDEQLLFIGHTHQPAIFLLGESRIPRRIDAQDFELEPEKRYLVNVGSVGQPRDGQARSSYCIFDTEDNSVCWRLVPFDLDAYAEALDEAGVSDKPSYFLRHDPRLATPPLRDILNFTPASTPEERAHDVVEVLELEALRRKVTKWKILFTLIVCLGLIGVATALSAWLRYRNRCIEILDPGMTTITAKSVQQDESMFTPLTGPVPAGNAIRGWRIKLGDKRKQVARVAMDNLTTPMLLLTSRKMTDELQVLSPRIMVEPGMKFCLDALFSKSDDFEGDIAIFISLTRNVNGVLETDDNFVVKPPNPPPQSGWGRAKKTFDIPANAHSIQFRISGKFTGQVSIKEIHLQRRN